MNEETTTARQGEITAEIVRLNGKKENLHDRINILFDRLTDVMRKSEPQKATLDEARETLSSQLAIDLSSVSATLETDIDKINDIIDRLEI